MIDPTNVILKLTTGEGCGWALMDFIQWVPTQIGIAWFKTMREAWALPYIEFYEYDDAESACTANGIVKGVEITLTIFWNTDEREIRDTLSQI